MGVLDELAGYRSFVRRGEDALAELHLVTGRLKEMDLAKVEAALIHTGASPSQAARDVRKLREFRSGMAGALSKLTSDAELFRAGIDDVMNAMEPEWLRTLSR